jgi:hypothetical protein
VDEEEKQAAEGMHRKIQRGAKYGILADDASARPYTSPDKYTGTVSNEVSWKP